MTPDVPAPGPGAPRRKPTARARWFSPRALLLHLEVIVVAPGCVVAGWWQATRALAGNTLSWVYSIEWPAFALIAIWVWWHLVHEDPEAYRARRTFGRRQAPAPGQQVVARGPDGAAPGGNGTEQPAPPLPADPRMGVPPGVGRWAAALAAAVGLELVLGIMALVVVPLGRPSGWLPHRGEVVYLVHAVAGAAVVAGAVVLAVRSQGAGRVPRILAWMGLVCVAGAAAGGLLTVAGSVVRFLGIAVMCVGSLLAVSCYLVPAVLGARHRAAPPAADEPAAGESASAH